jgi:NADPH:quinone reductase-like Zn-dependent oxidoreductase
VVRQLFGFLRSRFTTQKLVFVMAKVDAEDLAELARLVAAGQVAPVIDRRYRLEDAAAAIAYFARGHASGKVVIAMDTET